MTYEHTSKHDIKIRQHGFNLSVPGFNNKWWYQTGDEHSKQAFHTLKLNNIEVARAHILEHELNNGYIGLPTPTYVIEVCFLEIAENYRRKGIGRDFIAILEDYYSGKLLAAFSQQADIFWENIGWSYCPRKDGKTLHCRRLYISTDGKITHQQKTQNLLRE